MQSDVRNRIKRLMDEQAEEAEQPASFAMLDSGQDNEQESEPPEEEPDVPEPELQASELPEPPEDWSAPEEDEQEVIGELEAPEDGSAEQASQQDQPDPGWEDAIDDMEQRFSGDQEVEEYVPPEPNLTDEMGWQQALANRSNSN